MARLCLSSVYGSFSHNVSLNLLTLESKVDYMALRSYAYQAVYGSFSHNVTSLKGSFDS